MFAVELIAVYCGQARKASDKQSCPVRTKTRAFPFSTNLEQALVQKDEARGPGDSAKANHLLKDNRHLSAQQDSRPLSDLAPDRIKDLWARRRNVSSQDKNLGIEGVQETDNRPCQILQRAIEYVPRARISFYRSAKNRRSVWRTARAVQREFCGSRAMKVRPVIGFYGPGGKLRFYASVIAANA